MQVEASTIGTRVRRRNYWRVPVVEYDYAYIRRDNAGDSVATILWANERDTKMMFATIVAEKDLTFENAARTHEVALYVRSCRANGFPP